MTQVRIPGDVVVLRPGCTVDLDARSAQIDGRAVRLTTLEAALLRYLADRAGQDVSHDELHREVWGLTDDVVSRSAFRAVQRLRRKIEPDLRAPSHLVTVHGVGYRLIVDRPAEAPIVGRTAEIGALRAAVRAHRVVTVVGLGGIGKSTLVRAAGVGDVWVRLGHAATDDELVLAVAQALGVPLGPSSDDALSAALAARGPDRLVFDAAERCVEVLRVRLGRWLDQAPELGVVVTSRVPLGISGEWPLPLGPLGLPAIDADTTAIERSEAVQLWRACSPDPTVDGRQVAAIVRGFGGHPLAVSLAARTGATAGEAPLADAVDWACRSVSAAAQAAWAQLAVFVAPFSIEAVEAVVLTPAPAEDVLDELLAADLVARWGDRLVVLDAIRTLALARLADRPEVERRHAAWYATTSLALPEDLDEAVAAHRRTVASGDPLADRLALAIARRLDRTGPLGLALVVIEGSPGIDQPELAAWRGWLLHRTGRSEAGLAVLERTAEAGGAAAWARLAAVRLDRGEPGPARVALERAEALSVDPRLGVELAGLRGRLESGHGDLDEAGRWLERALRGAVDGGDRATEGAAALQLAHVAGRRAQFPQQTAWLARALTACRAAADVAGEGEVLGALGAASARAGRRDEAERAYRQALALHRDHGDRRRMGLSLARIGAVARDQGRWAEAEQTLDDALALLIDVGALREQATVIGMIGVMRVDQGRMGDAVAVFVRLAATYRSIGYRAGEGLAFGYQAWTLAQLGRWVEAEERYHQALAIHREERSDGALGADLGNLGDLYRATGRHALAEAALIEALALHRRDGTPRMVGYVLGSLARLWLDQGRHAEARSALQEALPLAADPNAVLLMRVTLAELDRHEGRAADAAANLAAAAASAASTGRPDLRAWVLCEQARARLAEGDPAGARAAWQAAVGLDLPPGSELASRVDAVGRELG